MTETKRVAGFVVLHYPDRAAIDSALTLVEHAGVRGRDALIAAVALGGGFGEIVSADRDFDGVPGLARVAPEAFSW